ncbi:hypothetical protein L209DRAFT_17157 [Thermothelomyces heterothallicus CBS 203.75]
MTSELVHVCFRPFNKRNESSFITAGLCCSQDFFFLIHAQSLLSFLSLLFYSFLFLISLFRLSFYFCSSLHHHHPLGPEDSLCLLAKGDVQGISWAQPTSV